jgi:membrane-bound metal-dependent hydrolase YbcI (DUF457 family)
MTDRVKAHTPQDTIGYPSLAQCQAARSGAACAFIFAADALLEAMSLSVALRALLDELSHVGTVYIVLVRLRLCPSRSFVQGAMLGATLIDLDHVPMAMRRRGDLTGQPRPRLHSLLPLLAIGAYSRWLAERRGCTFRGAAFGFVTHLMRDMATGGVPLFWPLSARTVRMPYRIYAAALLCSGTVLFPSPLAALFRTGTARWLSAEHQRCRRPQVRRGILAHPLLTNFRAAIVRLRQF